MNDTNTQNFLALKKKTYDIKFDLQNSKYEPMENIGSGAYGVVCSAINKEKKEKVAIKKIPCIFDQPTIAKRTYREIKILKHFKHDNIISIREILKPREGLVDYSDVYIVLDLMESDLHRIIHSQQELTDEHIRYFLYQLLRGLKYIHSANVIHRDLKPSNLLVNENCELKIGDFGMARGIASSVDEGFHYFMTQYVATRWYRAPELMMSVIEYTTAVDVWSVGCIFAEMLGKKQLFPGRDYIGQIKLIVQILGTPPKEFLKMCTSDLLKKFITGLGHKEPKKWNEIYPKANKKTLDLLSKMLLFNPKERISVEKALKHPYLNKYHDPDDEPICIPVFDFDFEKQNMTAKTLREVITEEIMDFHRPKAKPNLENFDLRHVPKADLSKYPGGQDQGQEEISKSYGGGLNAFLQQQQLKGSTIKHVQQTTSEQQAHKIQGTLQTVPKTTDMLKSSLGKPKILPSGSNCTDIKYEPLQKIDINSVKSSTDVEMLSAKAVNSLGKSEISEDKHTLSLQPVSNKPTEEAFQSDVEMLSARVQENVKLEASMNESLTEACGSTPSSFGDPKTIAASGSNDPIDTKALIKAAILNAGLRRQRNADGGGGVVEKSRPVTALQRQREREEKRKKKMEKAKERKKKDKKTNPSPFELSEEDKNLLARWNNMQGRAKPFVHPIRKVVEEKSSRTQQEEHSQPPVPSAELSKVTQETHKLTPQTQHIAEKDQGCKTQLDQKQNMPKTKDGEIGLVCSNHPVSVQGQVGQPPPQHLPSFPTQSHNPSEQYYSLSPEHGHQSMYSMPVVNLSPMELSGQNRTCSEALGDAQNPSHLPLGIAQDILPFTSYLPQTMTESPIALPMSVPLAPIPLSSQIQIGHSNAGVPTAPNTSVPCLNSLTTPGIVQINTGSLPSYTEAVQAKVQAIFHDQSGILPDSDIVSNLVPQNVQDPLQLQQDTVYVGMGNTGIAQQSSVPSRASTLQQRENEPEAFSLSQQRSPSPSYNAASPESQADGSDSNQSPVLTMDSKPNSALPELPCNWLMDLSKQIMKSHMEDLTLAQTPKGTGAGYGVGLDLDNLLSEPMAEGDCAKPDSAPLSASLIADWLDASGMDPKDMESLQRELGEMGSPLVF